MRTSRITALLNQHESTSLDFKRDQYRLTTDEEKSELIKDLLAFANTRRTSDAHIMIGVTEAPQPPHTITGITDPALDHHLQQIVNSKLNRPITFSYQTHELTNRTVGIITIARRQNPPHHLLKDFGKLKSNTVYVRRGSSTAIANPDEITHLTHTTRRAPSAATIEALRLTVMHRHDEIITVRGGRGIPGFAYTPREEHRFSLGEYLRLDAKLLIAPTAPIVIVRDLCATSITAGEQLIQLHDITIEETAETVELTTARVIRIKAQERVTSDLLSSSRATGIVTTITLATARGKPLQLTARLAWNPPTQTFTLQTPAA